MDPKREGKINKAIIKIASIVLLLVGIGVLVVEYIFWTEHWISNATAIVVFISSITIYGLIALIIIKNKNKIMDFGDED